MNPYEVLGISKDASSDEIKRAFRKRALQCHPDKGGDHEDFKKINEAYEILKDPGKKKMYDEFGTTDPPPVPNFGNFPFDMFFGGAGREQPQEKEVVQILEISLEQLFSGIDKKLRITVENTCHVCGGTRSRSNRNYSCAICKGSGTITQTIQHGPFVQQFHSRCQSCNGAKFSVPRDDECAECHASGMSKQIHEISIQIPPGTRDGHHFRLHEMAGRSSPGGNVRDLVLLIKEKPHDTFERNGDDLIVSHDIPLALALLGGKIDVRFVDGSVLAIGVRPLRSVNATVRVRGKGMTSGGSLFVKLNVMAPRDIDESCIIAEET
jgi:DnaJ family protein A protein 2